MYYSRFFNFLKIILCPSSSTCVTCFKKISQHLSHESAQTRLKWIALWQSSWRKTDSKYQHCLLARQKPQFKGFHWKYNFRHGGSNATARANSILFLLVFWEVSQLQLSFIDNAKKVYELSLLGSAISPFVEVYLWVTVQNERGIHNAKFLIYDILTVPVMAF